MVDTFSDVRGLLEFNTKKREKTNGSILAIAFHRLVDPHSGYDFFIVRILSSVRPAVLIRSRENTFPTHPEKESDDIETN